MKLVRRRILLPESPRISQKFVVKLNGVVASNIPLMKKHSLVKVFLQNQDYKFMKNRLKRSYVSA